MRKKPLKLERDAYQVALDLLARREHARVELEQKLQKKGFPESRIHQALQQLTEKGFQSDERYIEDFVRSRVYKGNGPLRILQELRLRATDQWIRNRG